MYLFEIIQSSLKENYYYINFLKSNLIQVNIKNKEYEIRHYKMGKWTIF